MCFFAALLLTPGKVRSTLTVSIVLVGSFDFVVLLIYGDSSMLFYVTDTGLYCWVE